MAAFFTNVCQWPNCAKKCGSLLELIDHIESTHIESDRASIEKREKAAASSVNAQSTCTALSYISRFFADTGVDGRKSSNLLADLGLAPSTANPVAVTAAAAATTHTAAPSPKRKKSAPRRSSAAAAPQADGERDQSSATTASAIGGDGDNGDSDDSWTYQDSMASEDIMKQISLDDDPEKPFICPVQGCAKRYKNVNGMKYHARHGHKSEKKIRKMHKCKCGKSYRSASSLRQHQQTHHHGDGQVPALDSTMLTPTTTSLASSLDSLAAQALSTSATTTSSQPQSTTRVPITLTQASTKLSLSTGAGQAPAPKASMKLMPSAPSSKKLPG